MRTKGATSNVWVKMSDLKERFNDNALILVARRFANDNKIQGVAVTGTRETIQASGNQPAVEEIVSVTEIKE